MLAHICGPLGFMLAASSIVDSSTCRDGLRATVSQENGRQDVSTHVEKGSRMTL